MIENSVRSPAASPIAESMSAKSYYSDKVLFDLFIFHNIEALLWLMFTGEV